MPVLLKAFVEVKKTFQHRFWSHQTNALNVSTNNKLVIC